MGLVVVVEVLVVMVDGDDGVRDIYIYTCKHGEMSRVERYLIMSTDQGGREGKECLPYQPDDEYEYEGCHDASIKTLISQLPSHNQTANHGRRNNYCS